jgi:hypothetical protein
MPKPSKLRKLVALRPKQMLLLATATVLVGATRVALLVLPVRRVRRIVHGLVGRRAGLRPEKRASLEELIRFVTLASQCSPVGSTCLAVALVAQSLLMRHGYESRFCIGVRRSEDRAFAAHAWLERDGRVIVGGPPSIVATYKMLPDVEGLIA